MAIKFCKYYVTDGQLKARVHYSANRLTTGQNAVTLYAKDYGEPLREIMGSVYQNDTDIQSDYFDKGRARIVEGHPLYPAALERARANEREQAEAYAKKCARWEADRQAARAKN